MKQKEKKTVKIAMYDLEGYLLEVLESVSISQIERDLDIPKSALHSCIKGWHLSTINRQFREVPNGKRHLNRIGSVINVGNTYLKPVIKMYKGRYICSYNSISDAGIMNFIDTTNISRCCDGLRNHVGGFQWKWA